MPRRRLVQLSDAPRLYQIDHFASPLEIEHILDIAAGRHDPWRRLGEHRNRTGYSFEMLLRGDRRLVGLALRIYQTLGFRNTMGLTMRFRRYAVGEAHPAHYDSYEIDGQTLIATAMLYLTDTAKGGDTHFPRAPGGSIKISPRRGRLVLWFNHAPDGSRDPASFHESLPVERGKKATLTNFVYQSLARSRTRLVPD